jgi:hypothetical protein
VVLSGRYLMAADLKRALLPGVYSLLGLCSQHVLEHINATLDAAGRVLFKTLHSGFTRTFRHSGRV